MPVRRRGASWQARIQHAGQRIERTFPSRALALEFERRTRARILDRRVGRPLTYGLAEALERWLREDAATLRSARDLENKARMLMPYCTGRTIEEIGDVAQRCARDWLTQGLTPATVNRRLAILRRVGNLAHRRWGWSDIALGARVRMIPGERARHVYLSPEDVHRLAAAARDPRVRDAIILAAYTGLRRGELLALTADALRDGILYIRTGKTQRMRAVPLPAPAREIALPLGLTAHELRGEFDRARERARMPHVRFHDLRHTYASWLVQSGAPLAAVRDLLGHASIATTGRYSHLATADLAAAIERLPGLPQPGKGRARGPVRRGGDDAAQRTRAGLARVKSRAESR